MVGTCIARVLQATVTSFCCTVTRAVLPYTCPLAGGHSTHCDVPSRSYPGLARPTPSPGYGRESTSQCYPPYEYRNPSTRLRDLRCHSLLSGKWRSNCRSCARLRLHLPFSACARAAGGVCSSPLAVTEIRPGPAKHASPIQLQTPFHRMRFAGADRSVSHDAREMTARWLSAPPLRYVPSLAWVPLEA
jgi:hypothetical protein